MAATQHLFTVDEPYAPVTVNGDLPKNHSMQTVGGSAGNDKGNNGARLNQAGSTEWPGGPAAI